MSWLCYAPYIRNPQQLPLPRNAPVNETWPREFAAIAAIAAIRRHHGQSFVSGAPYKVPTGYRTLLEFSAVAMLFALLSNHPCLVAVFESL